MAQNNPIQYGEAIQYQLGQVVTPTPVYASFNRNFATEPSFLVWNLRNVHQPVYTGQTQNNKGIDRPIFQVNIFAQSMQTAAKCDVNWLYNTYDNELGLNQIVLDCTLDIPT